MSKQEVTLLRNTPATLIPDGYETTLAAGERVVVTQALGGTVTVRAGVGLCRIESGHVDSLGPEVAEAARSSQSGPTQATADAPFSLDLIWDTLRHCYDPEIPVNLVDLGLIYDLSAEPHPEGGQVVTVRMTLTAQGCGMGPAIAADARTQIERLPQVREAVVEIVWDPPWNPHMISPAGRKMLGLD